MWNRESDNTTQSPLLALLSVCCARHYAGHQYKGTGSLLHVRGSELSEVKKMRFNMVDSRRKKAKGEKRKQNLTA